MGGLVWLASYPKSGNTWARAFLHNLLGGAGEALDINDMNRFNTTDNAPGWYAGLIDRPITDHAPEELAALRPRVHEAIARSVDGLVFLKTHNALVAHAGVPMITTRLTAGAIYIVRNPLDVAVSYSHHMGCGIERTIALMAERGRMTATHEKGVYQLLGSWSENVFSWTKQPNPSLFVMRYEDMLERPQATFGALANFLTLSPTPAQLARAIDLSSFEKLKVQETLRGYGEKPDSARVFFREGRKDQWRGLLTPRQVAAIVEAHGGQMRRYGYLPEGS